VVLVQTATAGNGTAGNTEKHRENNDELSGYVSDYMLFLYFHNAPHVMARCSWQPFIGT